MNLRATAKKTQNSKVWRTLLVNGRPRKARTEKWSLDRVVSLMEASIAGGATVSVEIPSP